MSSTPTDAELDALRQADNGALNFVTLRQFRTVARAVLAKWGQPAPRGEPVAWKHDCAALLTNDVELWIDACPHCGKPRNAPQHVERDPLTEEQITTAAKKLAECMDYPWDYMNYPGQAEMRKHARAVVEAAHGIRGGQQGD